MVYYHSLSSMLFSARHVTRYRIYVLWGRIVPVKLPNTNPGAYNCIRLISYSDARQPRLAMPRLVGCTRLDFSIRVGQGEQTTLK